MQVKETIIKDSTIIKEIYWDVDDIEMDNGGVVSIELSRWEWSMEVRYFLDVREMCQIGPETWVEEDADDPELLNYWNLYLTKRNI